MKKIHIQFLYPNEMNTYGDRGNILTLTKRLQWRGYEPVLHYHHPGKALPKEIDLVFGGGGQDSAQSEIQKDILAIGAKLKELSESGVPMLVICGTYQLFGHRFITHENQEIKGIGIFNLETRATKHRLIGNLAAEADEFGVLYGFENHSGQTYLAEGQPALGKVIRGNGNNDKDKLEGARIRNTFGTYMHGPVLPLNPAFADGLISLAVRMAQGDEELKPLNDNLANQAREAAKNRAY